jgi:hypothetical protein
VRQAQEGLDSVQIFSQIKTDRGGGFREKIFFDFYFFVWLVQTLTKTFFNSDNGRTFFNLDNGRTFLIIF